MACSNRVTYYEDIPSIGGQRTRVEIVKCSVKISNFDEKVAICQVETQLGLSSMLNDSCLFSAENEHECSRRLTLRSKGRCAIKPRSAPELGR